IAELLAILLTLGLSSRLLRSASDLAHYSLFIQWIALSSVAMLCISRPYLKKLSDPAVATLSYLLILLVSLVITEIAWWLIQNSPELLFGSTDSHALFTGRSMGISAIVSALALRYFYVQHQWRRNLERESESRIQALQSRIRPHFLFNCMNIIASLTRSEPRLAEEAIEDLSDLFRVSLQDARQLVNVSEEISLEGGYITIRGRKDPKSITIQVINPLPDDDPTDPHSGNQLALKNIRQRVEDFFGHRGKLSSYIEGEEYCAEIMIPYPYEDIDR
ncbi:MAG: histidine kinase, partial [Gammaproteobacteria bacterium]